MTGRPDETRSEEPWWLDQSREAWQILATSTDVKSGERGAWAEVVEGVDWLLADRARLVEENAELRKRLGAATCPVTWPSGTHSPPHQCSEPEYHLTRHRCACGVKG